MVLESILIVVGFVMLIKGADFLVNGASSLAKRYNVSDIAIGLTVVAMGTSAPELVVNLISGSNGHNDVVFGNIIGSNIFNMFLILGISSVIYPLTVQKNALWKEVPYSLIATIVLFILVNDQLIFGSASNSASVWDGAILLVMFVGFLYYVFQNMTRTDDSAGDLDEIEMYGSLKTALMIIFGIAGLAFGGQLIVDNSIVIAHHFDISEKVIGLTILAAGTSLPELATTAVAAFHKKSDLAVGNIVGSNIFNILLVLGATALFNGPLAFDIDLNLDLYIIMIGTFMLFLFMFTLQKYKLDRAEGALYLLGFVAYIVFLYFNRL
ncbi:MULTISPECIES: calcium/sodium antiporter [Reichenbachiella]|uniref:Cation:H+ antiporter n=1 Tax=Reichenbachiella agariperforans TaxID=156994 RepID=A0A1M6SI44_REIAG|nr:MULTISPECIES: calcium/sodium antiporter [Reichenbachiella]MBU2916149.1 calcium/sodium antiporter [Reichenbachiella agariperforans]RJE75005.1 sodium:proton exchanger [Reichenbachiella sp. MSK19-1]SHK44340.1 cation:H+ antiporter [Reichenbachiella agariperforans]